MNIAFFEMDGVQKRWLKEHFPDAKYSEEPLTEKNATTYSDADVIVVRAYSKLTRETLAKLDRVQLAITMSVGFDHIDIEECTRRNIVACNTPGYGDRSVAEHAFALLISLTKRICESAWNVRMGTHARLEGTELEGKTLGIVGCGRIGLEVAKIARGFGMRVMVFDVIHHESWPEKYGFSYEDFDTVLRADAITLHVPLNRHTKHLIDKRAIDKMNGTYIINTARGEVVSNEALIEGLKSGKIAGAGLDVVEGVDFSKPLHSDHPLLQFDNVIITQHNAYNTREALERRLEKVQHNILSFMNSTRLRDVLTNKEIPDQ